MVDNNPWRQFRNLTIADWMPRAKEDLREIVEEDEVEEEPFGGRIYAPAPRDATEAELLTTIGHGRWHNAPKERHVMRMFISAGLSVFTEVMRPSLEQKQGKLCSCFSEAVDGCLSYWDALSAEDRKGWAQRARDTKQKDHYVYLRSMRSKGREQPKKKLEWDEYDEDYYETDPDELPGVVCDTDENSEDTPPPSPAKNKDSEVVWPSVGRVVRNEERPKAKVSKHVSFAE